MVHELNLIPDDLLNRAEQRRASLHLAGTAVLCSALTLGIYSVSRMRITSLNQEVSLLVQERSAPQSIDQKFGALQSERERLLLIEEKYQDVTDKRSTSLLIEKLTKAIPPRVRLTLLRVNPPEQIKLKGRAFSNADLADFLANLHEIPPFSEAKLIYSKSEQENKKKFIVFEISKNDE